MAQISDLLAKKGTDVYTVAPTMTVLDATQLMNRQKVGALVVCQQGRVVGIFTERDVLRRVVAVEKNPAITTVAEVMTADVACATRDTTLEEASAVMKNRRIRHLPVCDEAGHLQGLVSIGDLNAWEADGQETTIHFLSQYIHGRV
ncbi:MAG: CBS domain-containing protein [Phycisphaerae bacterium]